MSIDNVNPEGKWEFNEEVTECFENMLSRSIPQYEVMRKSVCDMAKANISLLGKENFRLLDLGCSDGLMIEELLKSFENKGFYTGVDISEPMLKKAKLRHLDAVLERRVDIKNLDLRYDFPDGTYDIITSILSIQFTPIEYRQEIIQNVYNKLFTGGCFIMVEKVLGESSKLDKMMVETYYNMKKNNGYSQDQIDRKKLSLEGVLVPVTNSWNIELLKQAGFKNVDVFWRWMNFVGYVAIK